MIEHCLKIYAVLTGNVFHCYCRLYLTVFKPMERLWLPAGWLPGKKVLNLEEKVEEVELKFP